MFKKIHLRSAYNFALLIVLSAIGSLLPGSLASAVSPYDNILNPLPMLQLTSPNGLHTRDFSTNWASTIDQTWPSGIGTSLFNAMENGGSWMVWKYNEGNDVRVQWRPDRTVNLGFEMIVGTIPGFFRPDMTAFGFGYLRLTDTNQVSCYVSAASAWASKDYFVTDAYALRPFFVNWPVTYPVGYAGVQLPSSSEWADLDGDGLVAADETAQGTSNSEKDTDGDGLDDYVESQWYPNRNDVFCGTQCAYPDPTEKDLYVEVDWMKDSNNRLFKPNATQLGLVSAAYANTGINFHADTGQYGGGNELPAYIGNLYFAQNPNQFDFYDFKNGNQTASANFNSSRHRIWHYMVTGYQYQDIPGSSGVAYLGDDDLFISMGHIEDDPLSFNYNSIDTAIAGTILHELGHNICLSSQSYDGQDSSCQYSGIDTEAGVSYDSVMSYRYQMFKVDYSEGLNGSPNDHNDWSAVLSGGMADFANLDRNAGDAAGVSSKSKVKKGKLVRGITSAEAKELNRLGKLGGKYKVR